MSTENARDCSCCAGIDAATPRRVESPPGLAAIAYRAGRHGDFLESIRARLSSADYPALAALTTREAADFTLALSDALASSLDVLAFYSERYANEHYLRTATERLSVREMARLIGYRLAPGVAAGTHLAFTLKSAPGVPVEPITIPVGTRVQSVPGQDEQAQTFETVAPAPARAEWNSIPVQADTPWRPESGDIEVWLAGVATQVQPGDALLLVGADRFDDPASEQWDVRVANSVELDSANGRTRVRWSDGLGNAFPPSSPAGVGVQVHVFRQRAALFGHNAPNPNLFSLEGSNVDKLIDDDGSNWQWKNFEIDPPNIDLDSDNPKIIAGSWVALVSNQPGLGIPDLPGYVELYRADKVLHRSRSDFALSGKITRIRADTAENLTDERFPLRRTLVLAQSEQVATVDTPLFHPVYGDALTLGLRVADLVPGQPLALRGPRQRIAIAPKATGLSLTLDDGGSVELSEGDELFLVRRAARLFGSVAVALDAEAFAALIGNPAVSLRLKLEDRDGRAGTLVADAKQIRLAASRKDDPRAAEIAFIATTSDAITLLRDLTEVKLQAPIQHVYERATLRINANVAPATHGETVEAILGDGDGRLANQRFALDQAPLTYVSAGTPSGRTSTLELRVNDVLWTEVPSLYSAEPGARQYETSQDDAGFTTIQFGDGLEGARLPSITAGVRARYRKGIGAAGNVRAGTLTTLLSRPLGLSEAMNPEAATGGEDAEPLDRARDNAPLTVLTLDRAVSIMDYANFARAFAGIDKAHALWIPAGPARGVLLTIAGVDGAAVPEDSDTFVNLSDALTAYGDPRVPLRMVNYLDVRFRCALSVKVLAGFEVDPVLAAVDAALREHFGFATRRFGQPVSVDEVAAVGQAVSGVEAVHVRQLYRAGDPPGMAPRLFALLPVASLTDLPDPAQLLTLADDPLDLEILP